MLFFPNAKINLGLQILRKRADGFHDIASLFYPIDWQDVLEILPLEAGDTSFQSTGITIPDDGKENLCMRAYKLIQVDYQIPAVLMHLHKNIPIGAGMGGGSADASFVLTGLNKIFDLQIPTDTLLAYASRLGSDCAFFIENKAQLAQGRGELLTPEAPNLSGTHLLVVYPNLHITTAEAYQGVSPRLPVLPLDEAMHLPKEDWEKYIHNDFEDSLFKKYPTLPAIKAKLYEKGAFYASMTGSGSAIFGLFEAEVGKAMVSEFENYTTWKGKIL